MKTILTTLLFLLFSIAAFSQAPELLNYQAVLRNSAGAISQNQPVSVEFIIHSGSASGPNVYTENHNATTNEYGLVNLQIGKGSTTAGNFANVDWAANKYFLETIVDGASAGTQEMVSVPYSLYATRSGSADDDFDTDPANELQLLSISGDQLSLTDGGTVTIPQSPTYWEPNGNKIHNTNAGDVGIGTDTPTDKLHVVGTFKVAGNDSEFRLPNFGADPNFKDVLAGVFTGIDAGPQLRFNNTERNDFVDIGVNKDNSFVIETAVDDVKMIVKQNGNVGIGTSDAYHTFEVQTVEGIGTPTVDQQTNTSAGVYDNVDVWQSFTAGQTAYLARVDVFSYLGPFTGIMKIYEGQGTGGKVLHSQHYSFSAGGGWQTTILTKPLRVTAGQKYTLFFPNLNWMVTSDPYPGGQSDFGPNDDNLFKTYNVSSITSNVALAIHNGMVGIGTNTPREKLEVVGNICHTGSIGACSDKRYKTDFQAIVNPLEKIQQLNGLYYNWKTEEFPDKQFTDERQIGVIAQEVEVFFPEIVLTDEQGYKSVDYSKLAPILLEAIKEQQQMIEQLQANNGEMANQIQTMQANLSSRLDALESSLVLSANLSQRVTNSDE